MLYYRRKPLDVLPADALATEAERLATEVPNPAAPGQSRPSFVPPSSLDDLASPLLRNTRPEMGLPTVDPGAILPSGSVLPTNMSALSPDQSGAEMVARAVEILNQDLAAGALAASAAAPFEAAFPALNTGFLPTTDSLPGNLLPANMGQALNQMLQSAAQMQTPFASGVSPVAAPFPAPGKAEALPGTEEAVLLQPAGTVHAGEQANILFKLHNDSFRPVQLSLQTTDLTSPRGQTIPQSAISITPPTLSMAPDGIVEIVITIRIPAATSPGLYSGPFTAPALPYLQGVIRVRVD